MKQKNVAVFFGGCSPEYSVSLTSAHAVLSHLDWHKYNILPIGISKDGSWYYYTGSLEHLLDDTWLRCEDCIPAMLSLDRGAHKLYVFEATGISSLPVDVAFPVLHGKNGEDGTIQGAISLSGVALAGCGVLASLLPEGDRVALRIDPRDVHRSAEGDSQSLALADGIARDSSVPA